MGRGESFLKTFFKKICKIFGVDDHVRNILFLKENKENFYVILGEN